MKHRRINMTLKHYEEAVHVLGGPLEVANLFDLSVRQVQRYLAGDSPIPRSHAVAICAVVNGDIDKHDILS
jgi:DNA-binding transcriptional regulator YdaS (Cro superfamily)